MAKVAAYSAVSPSMMSLSWKQPLMNIINAAEHYVIVMTTGKASGDDFIVVTKDTPSSAVSLSMVSLILHRDSTFIKIILVEVSMDYTR